MVVRRSSIRCGLSDLTSPDHPGVSGQVPNPDTNPVLSAKPPGVSAIRVGSVLLLISVVIGLVGSILTVGRLDQASFTRDVVIDGKNRVSVPGKLTFRVAEPLSDSAPERMRVAVAILPTDAVAPVCLLRELEGDEITLASVLSGGSYVSTTNPDMMPVAVAELGPGKYQVSCELAKGQASADRSPDETMVDRFTVTRVMGPDDLTGELSPILWFAGVLVLAGLFFLSGGITLFVGLVQRGRARRITI